MTDAAPHAKYRRFHGLLTYAILLLVGLGFGIALIHFFQPPTTSPGSLLYEIYLFTSDKPVSDVTTQLAQIRQTSPGTSSWRGSDIVGNIQFASEPKMSTRFNIATPNYLSALRTQTTLNFESRGTANRDRVHTELKIRANGTESCHQFELSDEECRVVEFAYGEGEQRRWCYAIIKVQQAKAPPPKTTVVPRPAPLSTPGNL
jgi:hypothetical protein